MRSPRRRVQPCTRCVDIKALRTARKTRAQRESLATAQFLSTAMMPAATHPSRRHARRRSSQSGALPTPRPDPQTPTTRRRSLCRPPASVATRHAQVCHWNAELRDLTESLVDIQQRIQQLETLQQPRQPHRASEEPINLASTSYHSSRPRSDGSFHATARSRAPDTTYRLPELRLDSTANDLRLHLDDWLHASPLGPSASGMVSLSPEGGIEEQTLDLDRPASREARRTVEARQTGHFRDQSINTVDSIDSYDNEAVEVYEASTVAVLRPCVKNVVQATTRPPSQHPRPATPAFVSRKHTREEARTRQPSLALVPLPLFAGQKSCSPHSDPSPLQPRSSSLPLPAHVRKESRHSHPSPVSAQDSSWREAAKSRPLSEATVIRRTQPQSYCSTPSSAWQTESVVSNETPDPTSLWHDVPWEGPSGHSAIEQSTTPASFRPEQWQQSSPLPTEQPRLDSSCTSISDLTFSTSSLPKASPRLNIFPRIKQSSYESLHGRANLEYDQDPFYTISPEQTGFVERPSSPYAVMEAEAVDVAGQVPVEGDSAAKPCPSPPSPPRRKDHRLRGLLNPGIKRQTREVGSSPHLLRSPRKKLRTFLRRLTPSMSKVRHSMPAGSLSPAGTPGSLEKRIKTPPRLPTRKGSSLPFDEALLGELSRISDRGNRASAAAASPARRIRSSVHDAAGLTLSRTAATHAHWRAQRSRSSVLSSFHPRSRAPTGSTLYGSLSSGPSFHFLPKVDQHPMTPVRRGRPPGLQRGSRY